MSKLNKVKCEKVMVELGDKERELRFDLNAFAELENRFGSVQKAMQQMQSGSMKEIKVIIWVGLIHEEAVLNEDGDVDHYNITPYQVGSWITPNNLEEVTQKLAQALQAGMPDKETVKPDFKALPSIPSMESEMASVVYTAEELAAAEEKNV